MLHCMKGIIVHRKEISSYASVELTHEAVPAAENTIKMRAFRPLEKKMRTSVSKIKTNSKYDKSRT